MLLAEQDNSDRNDQNADRFDQTIQRTDHLRNFLVIHRLRLERQLRYIRILADLLDPRLTLPRYNKTSGKQRIAFLLNDLVRLTGDQ